MTRYARIEDGVVVNVAVADESFALANGLIACGNAGPGWLYANGVFSEPPVDLPALKASRKDEVMVLRDARIDGGLTFNGWPFQTRGQDRENVAGASQLAALWLMAGGDPTTLRWANPDTDFVWIDANNDLRPMSASTMIAFGKALAGYKSACIFHALALKETIDAATTAAAVEAVDITAGWPS